MFFYDNVAKYTPNIARWIDEIYAHKFANYHGGNDGSPLNTRYYNDNVRYLKGTSYKINAETLALPSFD